MRITSPANQIKEENERELKKPLLILVEFGNHINSGGEYLAYANSLLN